MRKALDFLLYSNIFIGLCAIAMAITNQIVVLGKPNLNANCMFIFFSTVFSYSYLKLTGSPGAIYKTAHRDWALANPRLSKAVIAVAFIGMAAFFFLISRRVQVIVMAIALVTFFYGVVPIPFTNPSLKLRDFGLLKTVFVSVVWSLATVLVPLADSHVSWQFLLFLSFRRFFFILALIMMFEIKDMPGDVFNKLQTVPVRLGIKHTKLLSQGILAVMIAITLSQFFFMHLPLWKMLAFNLSFFVSICCVQVVNENSPDIWYYLVIDGMMALQFIFVYLAFTFLNG